MQIPFGKLRLALDGALGLLSVFMIYDRLLVYSRTSGYVQGSEFGMLITLANQLSLVMLWLALFALRTMVAGRATPATVETKG